MKRYKSKMSGVYLNSEGYHRDRDILYRDNFKGKKNLNLNRTISIPYTSFSIF